MGFFVYGGKYDILWVIEFRVRRLVFGILCGFGSLSVFVYELV